MTDPVMSEASKRKPKAPDSVPAAPVVPTEPAPTTSPTRLYVESNTNAARTADSWRATRPTDAAFLDRLAATPQAVWFGDWNSDVYTAVRSTMNAAQASNATAVIVAYNIPLRDCGLYSAGGANTPDGYRAWIRKFADGIGAQSAIVILEPDALAGVSCLNSTNLQTRFALIRDAITVLKAKPGVKVYVDAGNPLWISASVMAGRLLQSGIELADGFALNVSNFIDSNTNVVYGESISRQVGNKRFVIDTSRNGLGPLSAQEWCNPAGRGAGIAPTLSSGHPLVDALLWIKRPGESDGSCNGAPAAGSWMPEYALGLMQRASSALALGTASSATLAAR